MPEIDLEKALHLTIKKNLAVKGLWKIIHQIKGFTLLIQIISFNFADIRMEYQKSDLYIKWDYSISLRKK